VTPVTRASRFVISGRVQGVGYRAFVADAARVERLEGWCRNLPDGSVEVLAEGETEALSRFEWRLWQGPSMARVDDVVSEDVVAEGAHGFRIA
jgi:acylphosphatase